MTKTNGCLRGIFLVFNAIFAGIGGLMVYGTIKATAFSSQLASVGGPSLAWSWIISIAIVGIAALGMYAGKYESAIALKVFAGFMGVSMVIMLVCGIIVVVGKNKLADAFSESSPEILEAVMDDDSMKEALDELQLYGHCCGVWEPSDWGNNIPSSCDCNHRTKGLDLGLGRAKCTSKPMGSTGPSQIYSRPCKDVVIVLCNMVLNVAIGLCFGFAVIALLGLLISLLMVHQIQRYDGMGRIAIPMKGF
ncbi:23 kDa integral membrane protein-like [Salarias fasciatus]|uniref:23 kDa integral membrane protein-like n=1 Tax=Salarias fasciatus TaxID=181472 RepID=UPI001176D4F9|nr:23 kDa integral membrane protein-like [Salarias fasciatus]XP_029969407.1 23 kDa integral membrane protein-like [Salarias fasciatus]